MRLCTFSSGGERRLGASNDDATVVDVQAAAADLGRAVEHSDLGELMRAGADALEAVRGLLEAAAGSAEAAWRHNAGDVTFHHPYRPVKNVIRAGHNSRTLNGVPKNGAAVELPPGRWLKGFPVRYYTKAPTAVLDPEQTITWPGGIASEVYAEPQLAIVVGRTISYVTSAEEALAAVAGYAVATDVVSNDLKIKHGQWPKATSLDTWFPWGPFIVTADEVADPDALEVRLTLNGDEVVSGSTGDALLSVGAMLAEISYGIPMEPGDVLLLGAPESLGFGADPPRWLREGDVLTSTIAGIGSLSNPVSPY